MTQNQIRYMEAQETARANKAKESENIRANLAKESENIRSNKAQEAETNRANLEKERLNREQWDINKYGSASGGSSKGVAGVIGTANSAIRTIKAITSDIGELASKTGTTTRKYTATDKQLLQEKIDSLTKQLYNTRNANTATQLHAEIDAAKEQLRKVEDESQKYYANKAKQATSRKREQIQGRGVI